MVAGAVFFFIRETEARECRQALASASATYGAYENEKINAALALAKEINREKAERCFVNGLIAAPPD